MMKLKILGAALFAAGSLWADDPSITLNRVQQRYPWNGMVDIDYTVANVPDPSQYYVSFSLTAGDTTLVLHEFLDSSMLYDASNGTYRVTWNSAAEDAEYHLLAKDVSVTAELFYAGSDKTGQPYGEAYMIIDLAKGTNATAEDRYPIEKRYFRTTAEACSVFNVNEYKTTKLVLRRVRACIYTMGSPTTEVRREKPTAWGMLKETQHPVTLTRSFYLGIFEVTQQQWTQVMGSNPSTIKSASSGTQPVETVSYATIRGDVEGVAVPPNYGRTDPTSFMGLISARTGLVFDLPTEAQFECACRAGTTTETYLGNLTGGSNTTNDGLTPTAWYYNYCSLTSHGVGLKNPSPWGFYDILGNVFEFCRDRVTSGAGADDWGSAAQTDPVRAVVGGSAVLRGGGHSHNIDGCRSAARMPCAITTAGKYFGFRLCQTIP